VSSTHFPPQPNNGAHLKCDLSDLVLAHGAVPAYESSSFSASFCARVQACGREGGSARRQLSCAAQLKWCRTSELSEPGVQKQVAEAPLRLPSPPLPLHGIMACLCLHAWKRNVRKPAPTHVCMHASTHMYACLHMHTCMHAYTCTRLVRTHARNHAPAHALMRPRTHLLLLLLLVVPRHHGLLCLWVHRWLARGRTTALLLQLHHRLCLFVPACGRGGAGGRARSPSDPFPSFLSLASLNVHAHFAQEAGEGLRMQVGG